MENIAHKKIEQCESKDYYINELNRKEHFIECLPLYDMKYSKINILDFSKQYYIHYDKDNCETYYLTTQFNLNKHEEIPYNPINSLFFIKENIYNNFKITEQIDIPIF